MTVLDSGSLVPSFYFRKPRLFYRVLIIAIPDRSMFQNIIGIFLMDLRRAIFHSLMYVKDKGQLFILYSQRTHGLSRSYFIFCYHSRNIIAVISHMTL